MARARLPAPRIAAFVAVLTCLSAPPAPCEMPSAGAGSADPAPLQDHLQLLEQHLRTRLRPAARWVAAGQVPAAELTREHDLFLAQLRLLEARIRTLETAADGELLRRLRWLREEVRHLSAAAAPPGAEPWPPDDAPTAKAPAAGSRATGLPPANDDCGSARPIGGGAVTGDTTGATADGRSMCPGQATGPDVWFRYAAPADAELSVYLTADSTPGHEISLYTVCPGTPLNEITCRRHLPVAAGDDLLIRVASREGDPEGSFTLIAEPAGSISGTVTDAATGDPLRFVEVRIWDRDDPLLPAAEAKSESDGGYLVHVPRPGTYFVETWRSRTHRDEIFDDVTCADSCLPHDVGTPVEVGHEAQVAGVDFALERLASIRGEVTEAATGAPIPHALVKVATSDGTLVKVGGTDPAGEYTLGGLDPGTYFVGVAAVGYFRELYDEIRCPDPDCSPEDGTPIPLELNADVEGIDFALEPLGRITGTVTDPAGQPIPLLSIMVLDPEGHNQSSGLTDDNGAYSAGDLYTGSYRVLTRNFVGYADEVYDDQPCPWEHCDPTIGTLVPVVAGATTAGVDFTLDRAGILTGTVTGGRTGAPLAGTPVWVSDANGRFRQASFTDGSGRYQVIGLATGTYFAAAAALDHVDELYDDIPCPGAPSGCDPTTGTPIFAATGSITPGIDFVLGSQGISGRVTDGLTGEPLRFATVWFRDPRGELATTAVTRFSGSYRALDLPPGSYFVTATREGYLEERYDDVPCPGGCDPMAGTPVEVSPDAVAPNVDFALAPLGSISGTVSDATGVPLYFVTVSARGSAGATRNAFTDLAGHYTLGALAPDTYVLGTRNHDGFIDERYDDHPCGEDGCDDSVAATPIPIALGTVVSGVDFALDRTGTLFGKVRNAVTGDPIPTVEVRVWDADGDLAGSDSTGGFGSYAVTGLDPGTYFVGTWGSDADGFIDQVHGDLPCRYGSCDPTTGAPVEVGFNSPSAGIDFVLDLEQGLSGRVTHQESGLPLLATVNVWNADGEVVEQLDTSDSGNYVGALPAGTYFLSTEDSGPGLTEEVYDDVPCSPLGCDPTFGTPVTVGGGNLLRDLDFALSGTFCDPGPCLNDDRFRVNVRWEDFELDTGLGWPQRLTADAGSFWFFGPDNIELVVKVLDACGEPFNHFWVFAAGLTNVATELTVTDTWTGERRTYTNPLGNAFELIRDTAAFATCELPAAPASPDPGADLARQTRRELDRRLELLAAGEPGGASAPAVDLTGGEGACAPAATTLCLRDGRFQVETSWRTADGHRGAGQAVPLTADTGTFWFFGEDNVEAIVKVLDACGLPSFNSYWVFAAGLTDVEVTLTVTDTVSGEVREYTNPLGTPFRAIQDTGAFADCP